MKIKKKEKVLDNPNRLDKHKLVNLTSKIAEVRAKTPEMDAEIVDFDAGINKKVWEATLRCFKKNKKNYEDVFFLNVLEIEDHEFPELRDFKYFTTNACPSPLYRQTVWKCSSKTDDMDLLWCIPRKSKAKVMRKHWQSIPSSHATLLKWIMQFYDGALDKMSEQINKELGVDNGR